MMVVILHLRPPIILRIRILVFLLILMLIIKPYYFNCDWIGIPSRFLVCFLLISSIFCRNVL
ncbi:hypothetical protein BDF14DRAFT_1850912 [Spinellus fusiger]|nr:hypothetical protein BDF14DRAFT_1850912 [Spinellus fusiger]